MLARSAPAAAWALICALVIAAATPAAGRTVVDASPPRSLAVTVYRDPDRGPSQAMERDWPQGFAMISESRQVTLPPGESTVRFEGVAEGMVAVSAIVTGLPGGTIEKNRNADLLSPAALVDGTLGNRVTITRTNPATGAAQSESAVVRTRADGGLVLQTAQGLEAVRCSGLPEKLTFERVPAGLSAQPVFTVDTRSPNGGTYTITLTYLAWGFDWQAHYVVTVAQGGSDKAMRLKLTSWLTLLNDNGQSFPDAELMAVAGKLNVVSDYEDLGASPDAKPLQLVCYPLGHTWTGSPVGGPIPPPPPPPPAAPMMAQSIVVTGARKALDEASNSPLMMAREEGLGDLKLYRVPEPVTVAAKGLKQVAFLDKPAVRGKMAYESACRWGQGNSGAMAATMRFETVNDAKHGLGVALPMGGVSFFEPSARGDLFVGEQQLRDTASGQDLKIPLGPSTQVFVACEPEQGGNPEEAWPAMKATLTNANPHAVTLRLRLGGAADWTFRSLPATQVKDGERVVEVTVPANGRKVLSWSVHRADAEGKGDE